MKDFRKNDNGRFICEECGQTLQTTHSLSIHIGLYHFKDKKIYYDKWLKDKKDGLCKECGKKTKFYSRFNKGYANCCSKKCLNQYTHKRSKKGMKNKYGYEYPLQSKEIMKNMIKTLNERYNCNYFINSQKYKEIMVSRYGVENTAQSPELYIKGFKKRIESGLRLHQFKNTDLTYQGTYELDFLENFYGKNIIKNGQSISYLFEGKNRIYHSDFFIPELNLIIEIKNSYLYKRDKLKIEAKRKATMDKGFKYIIIIDKNYRDFNILRSISLK